MIKFYWGRERHWIRACMRFTTGYKQWRQDGSVMRQEYGVNGDIRGMYGLAIGTKLFLGIITIERHGGYNGPSYVHHEDLTE